METKQLMRFDWVFAKHTVDFPNIDKYGIKADCPMMVDSIMGDKLVFLKGDDIINKNLQLCPEDIESVKLTDEIFMANGFEKYIDGDLTTLFIQKDDGYGNELYNINVYKRIDDTLYSVEITHNEGVWCEIKTGISDVHVFQHLLRMAGMEEMADNLKLK